LGYNNATLAFNGDTPLVSYDFRLESNSVDLDEVTINFEYKPVIIKKDTTIYDVSAFTSGKERKLKEVLNKIPGIEVDKKGDITVQGKKVTKVLIEDKLFFGGGSKLAVENIPANVLDKIEVLDDYNEISFLKGLSDNEDLALNIKLKEDKKNFIFGDIEVGVGDQDFYQAHAGIFYYSPKTNVNYIGDANNIGQSAFTFEDIIRFGGGISSFLKQKQTFTSLSSLAKNNQDLTESENIFSAFNISSEISKKININSYGVFSKQDYSAFNESRIQFVQNDIITEENRTNDNTNNDILGIANIKLDYNANTKSRWSYNASIQLAENEQLNRLLTDVNSNQTFFDNNRVVDNFSLKHFLEWHKSYNKKHKSTLVLNHTLEESNPFSQYVTNGSFLNGQLPLIPQENLIVNQVQRQRLNDLSGLFKHYWVINNSNHIYSNIGVNYVNQELFTNDVQQLDNNSENSFNDSGFGNDINYNYFDLYYGLEYKFRIGKKFTGKPALFFHLYDLENRQLGLINTNINRFLIEPKFDAEYEFNSSENIKATYRLVNEFPNAGLLADRFSIRSFNRLFRGNGLLQNERFHNASFRYSKVSLYRNLFFYLTASFNRKTRAIRNVIQLEGINQFTSPVFTRNPETDWSLIGNLKKKISFFELGLKGTYNKSRFIQSINETFNQNERENIILGVSLATKSKRLPHIKISYEKGFNEFQSTTNTEFQTDKLNTDFEIDFLKNWVIEGEFESFRNYNVTNSISNTFNILNASIRYQKENTAWTFELTASNLLNTDVKTSNSFTDFTINEQSIFILPRIALAKITYRL